MPTNTNRVPTKLDLQVTEMMSHCHRNLPPVFQITKVVTWLSKINFHTDILTEQVAEAVDDETEHWPVLPRLREELNKIKFKYRAVPLPIYINDLFIEPIHINTCIKGVLVELHFELHHFVIQKKTQDSFNTTIEQIIILRHHDEHPTTAYKRKNPHKGPIQVKVLTFIQKRIHKGPSKSNEGPSNKDGDEASSSNKCRKTTKLQKQVSEDENGASMSEKRLGKQKATESEDEIEEDFENNSD